MQLEHVNMTVSDLDRSAAFYSALLGIRERWSGTNSSGRRCVHLGDETQYLALFEAMPDQAAPIEQPDYGSPGLNHVGFIVDDLDVVRQRLIDLGCPPHHEDDYDPGRRMYAMDPNGIEIEFVTYD